ncbi:MULTISPECIES: hypothetical protein [Geobacillus]|jgi:alpha-galactosidase|uniref:family 4 glycosyl hydrolase n=1 Tax=Geobacillus TaxID=129337 RepID=UPI0009B1E540|nr:hypothetical protein [Geobacillus thermodenitrificans]NNU87587.1 hypothetical protein [Geobacillus sp. MR]PJW19645.1 hypothetical protein CV632_14845 [Geobacillus thermodenitrificans]PTR45823.1 hypothetical protein CW755_17075 [Geobacillus thermodenitrificans]
MIVGEQIHEYGAPIIHSIEVGTNCVIWGNVLNIHLITNLPYNSCVEVFRHLKAPMRLRMR